ncbi:MAG: hypothetical protein R3C12_13085 [Planctomycetaceae bacterium]
MNNNSWCVCLVLGFLIVVPMAGWAEPPGDHKPLTTFRPDRDFLQVPNVGVSEKRLAGNLPGNGGVVHYALGNVFEKTQARWTVWPMSENESSKPVPRVTSS